MEIAMSHGFAGHMREAMSMPGVLLVLTGE
jgi:hypothetical protein